MPPVLEAVRPDVPAGTVIVDAELAVVLSNRTGKAHCSAFVVRTQESRERSVALVGQVRQFGERTVAYSGPQIVGVGLGETH